MAKTRAKKKPARRTISPREIASRAVRDDLRRIRTLQNQIGTESRAIERAEDAANRRLERVLSVYCERKDKVIVDRAAWDSIRDEHSEMTQRSKLADAAIRELEERIARYENVRGVSA